MPPWGSRPLETLAGHESEGMVCKRSCAIPPRESSPLAVLAGHESEGMAGEDCERTASRDRNESTDAGE